MPCARVLELELGPGEGERDGEASEGRAFLLRKQRQRDAARTRSERLGARAGRLYEELARLASDARTRDPVSAGTRLLLDASFLVPRARTDEFTAVVRDRSEELAGEGLEVVLSGPWPAYNFVDPAP